MHDEERGVLTPVQLAQIQREMTRLLKELADRSDAIPPLAMPILNEATETAPAGQAIPTAPDGIVVSSGEPRGPWSGAAPILCTSGRGVLDEPVSAMLVQLLGKNGLHARVATFEAVSRENIASLDVTDVAMVCITYLELTGSPSHLRYLVRRIRQRLPEVPILVGLWPAEDLVVLRDDRLRSAVGAGYYTTSLRDAVTTCLTVAGEASRAEAPLAALPTA